MVWCMSKERHPGVARQAASQDGRARQSAKYSSSSRSSPTTPSQKHEAPVHAGPKKLHFPVVPGPMHRSAFTSLGNSARGTLVREQYVSAVVVHAVDCIFGTSTAYFSGPPSLYPGQSGLEGS